MANLPTDDCDPKEGAGIRNSGTLTVSPTSGSKSYAYLQFYIPPMPSDYHITKARMYIYEETYIYTTVLLQRVLGPIDENYTTWANKPDATTVNQQSVKTSPGIFYTITDMVNDRMGDYFRIRIIPNTGNTCRFSSKEKGYSTAPKLEITWEKIPGADVYRYVDADTGSDSDVGYTPGTAWKTVDYAARQTPANAFLHLKGEFFGEPPSNKIAPINSGIRYVWDEKVSIENNKPLPEWSWSTWATESGIYYPNGGATLVADNEQLSTPDCPAINPDPFVGRLGANVYSSNFYDPSPGMWAEAEKTITGSYTNLSLWLYPKFYTIISIDDIEVYTGSGSSWREINISQSMVNPKIKIRVEVPGISGGGVYIWASNLKLY